MYTYINYNGLSVSKSSSQQLWPILGRIISPFTSNVFTIGIYGGAHKPSDTDDMFHELVTELTDVCTNDIYEETFSKRISFTLKAVICDAPARAGVKRTIGHNGRAACDKCSVVKIQLNNKIIFRNGTCTLRDDKSFRERLQGIHHRSTSSFECLPLNMVNDFPLDPMHLVYLGVVKKLVTL
ncbi:calcium-transporting atpase sarcoplasmic endoplasmic reticulum type (calcium pump) [Schistosoma japonicum]|uniref:Calcium-transporting atpase sarcoplasmic endoplasmic reticulum type (Calcium pump) n=1 Tax=Schistosoma japonicum TaxID=6182 RepID=A0A4Z2CPM7_SCHJA|nr:calcium-transporting atpase sarcoplasmic endoplasmic reticulum type (calcium pump) [Schistosoma japonicum]